MTLPFDEALGIQTCDTFSAQIRFSPFAWTRRGMIDTLTADSGRAPAVQRPDEPDFAEAPPHLDVKTLWIWLWHRA